MGNGSEFHAPFPPASSAETWVPVGQENAELLGRLLGRTARGPQVPSLASQGPTRGAPGPPLPGGGSQTPCGKGKSGDRRLRPAGGPEGFSQLARRRNVCAKRHFMVSLWDSRDFEWQILHRLLTKPPSLQFQNKIHPFSGFNEDRKLSVSCSYKGPKFFWFNIGGKAAHLLIKVNS